MGKFQGNKNPWESAWEWACSNLCFRRLGGSEPQEMRVLAKLDILSSQVAAAVCDSQQN